MPRQPGKPWTKEEDDVLKRFMRENRKYSWAEIIKQGNLKGRNPKSCSHRWHNFLKSDFKRGKFSDQEDEQIINLKFRGESWASMAKNRLLEQRSPLDIRNRWNNHLVKRLISDLGRRLLTDDETSDHSVPEDDLKARMAEFHSNVDPNEISSDDKTSDLEASTSGSADLIPNHDPNALHSITETFTR